MPKVPEGYVALDASESFRGYIGPIYLRDHGGFKTFGLHLEKRHCNINWVVHGGFLAALSDIVLSYTLAAGRSMFVAPLTLSLTTEFIGSAGVDAWIEAHATLKKSGGNITFATCEISGPVGLIAQASGVFKFPSNRQPS